MEELKFTTEELQLIAFKLGSEEYTVPIITVQEIIMPQTATHLPHTPAFMEGVINLRGHVIPVIDGRKRFDIPVSNSAETRIMVLELDNHTVGLIVDSVSEVIHLKTNLIEPAPIETNGENNYILGIGKFKNRLLILLDPNKFLSNIEIKSIQNISKAMVDMAKIADAEVETL